MIGSENFRKKNKWDIYGLKNKNYSQGYFFRIEVYQVLLAQQERHQGKF